MMQADQQDGRHELPEIPGYRVLRVLGSGGMSTIYLGEQRSLHRQVAIKVMLPEALTDEISRRRFENEARTIARLEHPTSSAYTRSGAPARMAFPTTSCPISRAGTWASAT